MSILKKISKKNLFLNKKRTIGIIIGIILSVSLICAVSGMFTSFRKALVNNAIKDSGYYHLTLYNRNNEELIKLENNRDIKKIYELNDIGYSNFNTKLPYLHLFSFKNKESFKELSLNLVSGEFPTNNNEIIISETINYNLETPYKVGDILSLDIGERKDEANNILNRFNSYTANEKLDNITRKQFKITGIVSSDYRIESHSDGSAMIITTNLESSKKDLYVALNKPKDYKKSLQEMFNIKSDYIDETKYNYSLNNELLRWETFNFSDNTISMIYAVIGVVLMIIIGTSIFCIKNSIDMATNEKKKMYGMLLSIGATKKQIKKSVLIEVLMLGLIAIPLGIIFGILAVYILTLITNNMINSIASNNDLLIFDINILTIIVSFVLGFITIYLSSISAAKKASKLSPIESIKNKEDKVINSKNLNSPKFINKIFKTGGVIAYKNLKRSKRKYRTTVISLIVSICTFISLNTFITYGLNTTGLYYEDLDYNLVVSSDQENISNINKLLKMNLEDYRILYYPKNALEYYLEISDLSKVTDFTKNTLLKDSDCKYDEKTDISECKDGKVSFLNIVALESNYFKEYVKSLGLKYENVKKGGILLDEYLEYVDSKKTLNRIYNYKQGDIIKGTINKQNTEIKVAKITNNPPRGLEQSYSSGGYLIIDKESLNIEFIPEIITINSSNPNKLENKITKNIPNLRVQNIAAFVEAQKNMTILFSIFLYGFITVITLIGVTNIFNTITANIELRQHEFAVLKSIGMTKKEFNNMINLETLFYSLKSLIYGIIIGLIGSYLMYKAFSKNIDLGFIFPYKAIIISILAVFILVFSIMKYSVNKVNKQNIIETIRKENI